MHVMLNSYPLLGRVLEMYLYPSGSLCALRYPEASFPHSCRPLSQIVCHSDQWSRGPSSRLIPDSLCSALVAENPARRARRGEEAVVC